MTHIYRDENGNELDADGVLIVRKEVLEYIQLTLERIENTKYGGVPFAVMTLLNRQQEDINAIRTHMHDIENKLSRLECISYDSD